MLRPILFLLALAANAVAQSETLDLSGRGQLTLFLLGDWRIDTAQFRGQGSISITPLKESVNAACNLTVTYPETDSFDTKARLKLRVEADGYSIAESSVEGKAYGREFSLRDGYGFYCNFTDRELRGRPSQTGNYKVMSVGRIRLASDILIEVQIMADSFSADAYQQLLGAIEGMEFKPRRR